MAIHPHGHHQFHPPDNPQHQAPAPGPAVNPNNNHGGWDPFEVSFMMIIVSVAGGIAYLMDFFNLIVDQFELALIYLKPRIAPFLLRVEKLRVIVNTPLGAVLVVVVSAVVIVLCAIKLYRTLTRAPPRSLMGHIAKAATPIIIALLVTVILVVIFCLFSSPGTCTAWANPQPTQCADLVDGFVLDYPGASPEELKSRPMSRCVLDELPPDAVVKPVFNGATLICKNCQRNFGSYAPDYIVYGRHSAATYKRIVLEGLERCKPNLNRHHIRMRTFTWRRGADDTKLVEHVDVPLEGQKWLDIDKAETLSYDNAQRLCNTMRDHSKFKKVQLLGHIPNSVQPGAYFIAAEKNVTDKKFYYRGGPLMFEPLEVPEDDFCRGAPENLHYQTTVAMGDKQDGKVCLRDRAGFLSGPKSIVCEFSPVSLHPVDLDK